MDLTIKMDKIEWIFLPGGVCAYGDQGRQLSVKSLWWTVTPITWEQAGLNAPNGIQDSPLTCLTHKQAMDLAYELGGRLPKSVEWEWMAGGVECRQYPWGSEDWSPSKANLQPSKIGHTISVRSCQEGATPEGILDVAGNVWEWTLSSTYGDGAIVRGGSYNSIPLYARTRFLNAAPKELSSQGIGIRVVRES